jgi:hypothetical protein
VCAKTGKNVDKLIALCVDRHYDPETEERVVVKQKKKKKCLIM